MKILIVCGSLTFGKDGVGDYSRILGGHLNSNGNSCKILALMDKFTNSQILETQECKSGSFEILRLPFKNGCKFNSEYAETYINEFNPDWISLQYVPFSFNNYGLPFGLSKHIIKILRNRKLHVMFHELWVGMDKGAYLKIYLLGKIQKLILIDFINKLNPDLIHTQSKLYQIQLKKIGILSDILPLFSNIEVLNSNKKSNNNDFIEFIVFGSIHPDAPIREFAKYVTEFTNKHHKSAVLTFIGRCGKEQKNWINVWKSEGLNLNVLNEQTPQIISKYLSRASIGISTTPPILTDKSGSVAAMLAHGLPVICISKLWKPRYIKGLEIPSGIFEFKQDVNLDFLQIQNNVAMALPNLEIGEKLIDSFEALVL